MLQTGTFHRLILLMEEVRLTSYNQLRLVVYHIIFRVLYIPGGAGFLPSTVDNASVSKLRCLKLFFSDKKKRTKSWMSTPVFLGKNQTSVFFFGWWPYLELPRKLRKYPFKHGGWFPQATFLLANLLQSFLQKDLHFPIFPGGGGWDTDSPFIQHSDSPRNPDRAKFMSLPTPMVLTPVTW